MTASQLVWGKICLPKVEHAKVTWCRTRTNIKNLLYPMEDYHKDVKGIHKHCYFLKLSNLEPQTPKATDTSSISACQRTHFGTPPERGFKDFHPFKFSPSTCIRCNLSKLPISHSNRSIQSIHILWERHPAAWFYGMKSLNPTLQARQRLTRGVVEADTLSVHHPNAGEWRHILKKLACVSANLVLFTHATLC